jgi:hypothetical protein
MRARDRLYVYPVESTSTGATAYKSIGLRLRTQGALDHFDAFFASLAISRQIRNST